jgi:hypothetical protein
MLILIQQPKDGDASLWECDLNVSGWSLELSAILVRANWDER